MFKVANNSVKIAALFGIGLTSIGIFSTLAHILEPVNLLGKLAQAEASTQSGDAFTDQERTQLIKKFLANPQVALQTRNQRVRVLSLVSALSDKEATNQQTRKLLAKILLFNYSTNKTTRYLVDASSGEVLKEESLPGQPPASAEEIQEAIRIIRANPELANLLRTGGILEGGFIVDAPKGALPNNRYLQMQLLTSDRLNLQRWVTVDLTNGTIASSRRE